MRSLLLVAGLTIPAAGFAYGGWAVVTVEDVPEYAVAGRSFGLTYTVRQHGMTTRENLDSYVTLIYDGQKSVVRATPLGEGIYRAPIVLPQAGTWGMHIESGWGPVGGDLLPLKVVAANAPAPAPMSHYERGHQLYLAKGCATCHTHQLVKNVKSVAVGPDLSEPKFTSAYLARFLANPEIKTNWASAQRMPNLGLKPAEISALAAFLNREGK